MKRLGKIALIIAAVPIALVALAFAAMLTAKTGALDRYVLDTIKSRAAAAGISLEAEKFEFDPFVPSVRVSKISAKGPGDRWTADCEALYLSVRPLASLAGDITFSLLAEKPRIKGEASAIGAGASSSAKGSSGFDLSSFRIERMRITDGSFDMAYPSKDMRVVLSGFTVDWLEKRGKGGLAGGSVTWKGETEEILSASFEGERANSETRIESVVLRTTRAALTGGLKVGVFDGLAGEFNLRLDLRDLPDKWLEEAGLAARKPIGGLIEILGQVGGSLDAPALNCVADLSSGRFGSVRVDSASANADLDLQGLKVKKLTAKTTAGEIKDLKGNLTWNGEVKTKVDLEVSGFDLRAFMAPFVENHFPVGLLATGKFSAKGSLHPKLDLECRGKAIDVKNFDVTTTPEGVPETWYGFNAALLDVQARVLPDKIEFRKSKIDAGSVTVDIAKGEVVYASGLEFQTALDVKNIETIRRYVPSGLEGAFKADGRLWGPYRELQFDYNLQLSKVAYLDKDLGTAKGHASFDLVTLKLDQFTAAGPLGEVAVNGSAVLRTDGDYRLSVRVKDGNISNLESYISTLVKLDGVPHFQGVYQIEGELNGKLAKPVFVGRIRLDDLLIPAIGKFKGARGVAVSLDGSFGVDGWRADKAVITHDGISVAGTAVADLESVSASGGISSLKLENIANYVDQQLKITGNYNAAFSVEGSYADPRVELTGAVDGLTVGEMAVGTVKVGLALKNRSYHAALELPDGTAKIDAELNPNGRILGELGLDRFPWYSIPGKFRPAGFDPGTISGTAKLEARTGQQEGFALVSATWKGELSSLTVGNYPVGKVETEVAYPLAGTSDILAKVAIWDGKARARLQLDPIKLENPRLGIQLVKLELEKVQGMPKAVKGGELDLDTDFTFKKIPSETKELRSIVQDISSAEITGAVTNLRVSGYPKPITTHFAIRGRDGEWALETEVPPLRDVKVKSEISDLSWNLTARLEDCDPSEFVPALVDKMHSCFFGTIEVRGTGAKLQSLRAQGNVKGLKGYGLGPFEGKWRVATVNFDQPERAGISFGLELPGGVTADGVWLTGVSTLNLNVALADTPLELYLPTSLKESGYSGKVKAGAELSIDSEGKATGAARVETIDLVTPKGSVSNSGEILVTFDHGKVFFEKVALLYEGLEWYITGTMKPGESFDVKGKVSLDLQKFIKNVPHVESISGRVDLEAGIVGPWASPKVSGVLDVREGGELKLDKFAYPLTKISAHLELAIPGDLRVENISAKFGEGNIHAEGRVTVRDFMPDRLELFVETRNIHYEYPRGASYDFDGDFMVTGPLKQVEVRGEARLKSFLHSKTIMWRTATLALAESAKKSRVGARETGDIYIDIAVLGSRNLKIENNIANLDLGADLRVKGYLPSPEVLGRLDINSGTLRFRGREYKLLRSNIEFMGNVGPFAVLDGRATTTVGEYTVNVSATGPIEDVKVDMSSVPALPRTDIVALLALGTTSEHLENSEVITAFEATNILTGSIQDELEGQAYNVFGIDQFQINPTYSKSRQTTVPHITVGKALSSSVFARYAAEIGVNAEQEVSLEYLLKPGVIFKGTWTDQGTQARGSFGGELRFRHTFR